METLRLYLGTLPVPDQAKYAERCGTTIGYLRKAISTKQRIEGAVVRKLWDESQGAVSRHQLRPDIWPDARLDAWPEVVARPESISDRPEAA